MLVCQVGALVRDALCQRCSLPGAAGLWVWRLLLISPRGPFAQTLTPQR